MHGLYASRALQCLAQQTPLTGNIVHQALSSQHRYQKAVSTQGVAEYVNTAEKVSQQQRRVPQLVHALSGYKYRSAGLSRLRSLHARYEFHVSDPSLPHACMCCHGQHTPALVLQKPCEDP
jgi:hypothetical protein